MGPLPTDPDPGLLARVAAALLAAAGRYAVPVALVGAFVDSLVGLGVLVPGGTAVILAGFAARGAGAAGFLQVAPAAWTGQVLATAADYWLGRLAGRRLVPRRAPWRLAARWRATLGAARAFLARWGGWALVVANLAEPGRSSLALAAGASRWPFGAFIARQAAISAVWCAAFVGLGFFAAGGGSEDVLGLIGGLGAVMAGLLLLAVAGPVLAGAAARYRRARPGRPGRPAAGASDAAEEVVSAASAPPG
jgi:membrane-associated protein